MASMDYDPVTGEYLDPVVGLGHDPNSPFAGDEEIPTDYIAPDADESQSSEDLIVDAVHELYPDLDGILDFAIATYGDEITQMYDEAIDSDDWATVHNFLEQWSEEFRENQAPEVDYEEVNQELNQLVETEAEGMETAFELLQQAEQSDNPTESAMLQMASAFHKGEVSAQDAIQQMLDTYPIEDLIKTYNQLNK